MIVRVDDVDRALVAALLSDGRASFAELGAAVSLSASAVKRRVDRLRAQGVIRGFTTVVDPAALGWRTEAYVEVYCKGTVAPELLRRSLEGLPEVVGACTVSGQADALVHILAEDVQHLEQALERVRAEPHVDHTVSAIVLSRLVDR
jgi:DNA-binding Lrp family transcriptional regulator